MPYTSQLLAKVNAGSEHTCDKISQKKISQISNG